MKVDPHLFHWLVDDPRTRGDGNRPECFLCGQEIHHHKTRGLKIGHVSREPVDGEEPDFTTLPLWCHNACANEVGAELPARYHKALDAVMRGGRER